MSREFKLVIFIIGKKIFFKIADFQIFFFKSSQNCFWNIFTFLNSRGNSQCLLNVDFKNNWFIAVWKFRLWIIFQQFSTYIWQTDQKLKFSNGYNSVIFKVKIYDKISRHWKLPREFKNAKIFQKKIWEDFLKNIWKSAI